VHSTAQQRLAGALEACAYAVAGAVRSSLDGSWALGAVELLAVQSYARDALTHLDALAASDGIDLRTWLARRQPTQEQGV